MKRFYAAADIREDGEGFLVTLDGRGVKTPLRRSLVAPTRTLAEAVAAEWNAQGETIEPKSMPLTQLLNTMIDRVAEEPAAFVEAMAVYGETDLVCYWAEQPRLLVERQRAAWQPLLDWAASFCGARLVSTQSALHVPQDEAAIDALREAIAALDAASLTALQAVVPVLGSLVIGLALVAGRLDAETAFAASQIDETYQAELWGQVEEVVERRDRLLAEVREAARFLTLARAA
jgi:chaperone required for assembly of F1-ATPase